MRRLSTKSKQIVVHLTHEEIARGVRWNAFWCPIARGIRDQHDNAWDVHATQAMIYVTLSTGIVIRARCSKKAAAFMAAFDRGEVVKPTTIRLRIS